MALYQTEVASVGLRPMIRVQQSGFAGQSHSRRLRGTSDHWLVAGLSHSQHLRRASGRWYVAGRSLVCRNQITGGETRLTPTISSHLLPKPGRCCHLAGTWQVLPSSQTWTFIAETQRLQEVEGENVDIEHRTLNIEHRTLNR